MYYEYSILDMLGCIFQTGEIPESFIFFYLSLNDVIHISIHTLDTDSDNLKTDEVSILQGLISATFLSSTREIGQCLSFAVGVVNVNISNTLTFNIILIINLHRP